MATCTVQGKHNHQDGPSKLASNTALIQVDEDHPNWKTKLTWSDNLGPRAVYTSAVAAQDAFIKFFEEEFPHDMVS